MCRNGAGLAGTGDAQARELLQGIAEELGATYWDSLDQMLARMDIAEKRVPQDGRFTHRSATRAVDRALLAVAAAH